MVILPSTQNFELAAKLGLDIPAMMAHVRGDLAALIRHSGTDDLDGIIRRAVIDFGGTLVEPGASNWDPLEYEISLLGCSAHGATIAEAASQWAKAAKRMAAKPDRDAA